MVGLRIGTFVLGHGEVFEEVPGAAAGPSVAPRELSQLGSHVVEPFLAHDLVKDGFTAVGDPLDYPLEVSCSARVARGKLVQRFRQGVVLLARWRPLRSPAALLGGIGCGGFLAAPLEVSEAGAGAESAGPHPLRAVDGVPVHLARDLVQNLDVVREGLFV
jgi:hypothetical protein